MLGRERFPGLVAMAVLLLSAALAGCTQEPPPAPMDPAMGEEGGEGGEPGLVPSAEAANASQPDDQSEFAKSLDEKFHVHDYWSGALEKTLMDEDVDSYPMTPDPLGPQEDLFFYLVTVFIAQGPGLTPFQLPEGSIVPPETERLEVEVTWNPTLTISGLFLAYSTAADESDDITALDPLPEGGGTYTIPTELGMNDIPHTSVSKWRFYLVPDSGGRPGPAIFNGTVHVTIKAFRNDTLYVAPPHPDFWAENTTLPLFNQSGPYASNRVLVPVPTGFVTGGEDRPFVFIAPPENVTIPPHTGLLTLVLEWENNATLPDPFNAHLELEYGPPNSFTFAAPEGRVAEDGRITYTIAVDPRMWDSPYAEESQWRFLVFLDSDAPTDQDPLPFGDVAFFDGHYRLSVVAEREQV